MGEKMKKVAIVIGMVVFSIAFGILMPAHGGPTQKPNSSCDVTGIAGAGTPYQLAGSSPPQIIFKGTTYCKGGSFYREMTNTTLYVDDRAYSFINIACNPHVDPCHANGQVTKLYGCHIYQTEVDSSYQPSSGQVWFAILNSPSWSNTWRGCRKPLP